LYIIYTNFISKIIEHPLLLDVINLFNNVFDSQSEVWKLFIVHEKFLEWYNQ